MNESREMHDRFEPLDFGSFKNRGRVKKILTPPIDLKLDGVVVHPVSAWPKPTYGIEGKFIDAPEGRELHTVQSKVHADVIAGKVALIQKRKRPPYVTVVCDKRNRLWILDGHHTLAAYRQLGRTPKVFIIEDGQFVAVPPKYLKEWKEQRR